MFNRSQELLAPGSQNNPFGNVWSIECIYTRKDSLSNDSIPERIRICMSEKFVCSYRQTKDDDKWQVMLGVDEKITRESLKNMCNSVPSSTTDNKLLVELYLAELEISIDKAKEDRILEWLKDKKYDELFQAVKVEADNKDSQAKIIAALLRHDDSLSDFISFAEKKLDIEVIRNILLNICLEQHPSLDEGEEKQRNLENILFYAYINKDEVLATRTFYELSGMPSLDKHPQILADMKNDIPIESTISFANTLIDIANTFSAHLAQVKQGLTSSPTANPSRLFTNSDPSALSLTPGNRK